MSRNLLATVITKDKDLEEVMEKNCLSNVGFCSLKAYFYYPAPLFLVGCLFITTAI